MNGPCFVTNYSNSSMNCWKLLGFLVCENVQILLEALDNWTLKNGNLTLNYNKKTFILGYHKEKNSLISNKILLAIKYYTNYLMLPVESGHFHIPTKKCIIFSFSFLQKLHSGSGFILILYRKVFVVNLS
jgi:hypothetical protein